jgi:hypothetical protein
MILTLTAECAFGAYLKEQCIRTIEIDEEARLYDLHEAIQDAVQFGRDHPFQFFLANSASPSARKQWLTEKEEWEDMEDDFQRIILKDIYPLGRKRLYYLFDFGDRWTFEIRRPRKPKARGGGQIPTSGKKNWSESGAVSKLRGVTRTVNRQPS